MACWHHLVDAISYDRAAGSSDPAAFSYRFGDVLRCPDLSEFQVTWVLCDGLAQLKDTIF